MSYLDQLWFVAFPYVAFSTFFLMTIRRYVARSFSYSSLSSQFLENRQHFWGLVPLHYGILVIITGHFIGFLIPRQVLWWNSRPLRLWILEASALIFALLALVGLVAAMVRRGTVSKARIVTSPMDWVVLGMLLLQIVTGISIALHYPWGSSWYSSVVSPYFWSILTMNPQAQYIAAMPWLVKLHMINAWAMIMVFPFTRLVHVLVVPNPYLWRKPQVVRWATRG
jgi:nitrate reductase gamma subunit